MTITVMGAHFKAGIQAVNLGFGAGEIPFGFMIELGGGRAVNNAEVQLALSGIANAKYAVNMKYMKLRAMT